MTIKIPKNIILVGIGAVIIILAILVSSFAFTSIDASINVNSAFYANNIVDKNPVNGKFLIMNVTVKNKGDNPITVSTNQFTPMINGKPVDKYSVFSGQGTDLQNQINIPGGATKDIIIVFDIKNQTPDSLEFSGPFSWAPTYRTNTKIVNIAPKALFDGRKDSVTLNFDMSSTKFYGINLTMAMNINSNITYEKTDNPDKIKSITDDNGTVHMFMSNGAKDTKTSQDKTTDIIDLKTGLNKTGELNGGILPENLTKPGDSITIQNGTITIKGSEEINIMGKRINSWVTSATVNSEGIPFNATVYYDKTTRIILKMTIDEKDMSIPNMSGLKFTVKGEGELMNTNVPLIGVI